MRNEGKREGKKEGRKERRMEERMEETKGEMKQKKEGEKEGRKEGRKEVQKKGRRDIKEYNGIQNKDRQRQPCIAQRGCPCNYTLQLHYESESKHSKGEGSSTPTHPSGRSRKEK